MVVLTPWQRLAAVGALVVGAGCDEGVDDAGNCHGLGYEYCQPAMGLALRTTTSLTASDDEIHAYYRKLRPFYEREPVLAFVIPFYGYSNNESDFALQSSHPALLEAWTSPTGPWHSPDERVNAILADAPRGFTITPSTNYLTPPGAMGYMLDSSYGWNWMSWRVLTERLAAVPDTIWWAHPRSITGMDLVHTTNGTDDVFEFAFGWGDCDLGCIFVHRWTGTLHADGTIELTDLGGAPVTEGYYANAANLPPLPDI